MPDAPKRRGRPPGVKNSKTIVREEAQKRADLEAKARQRAQAHTQKARSVQQRTDQAEQKGTCAKNKEIRGNGGEGTAQPIDNIEHFATLQPDDGELQSLQSPLQIALEHWRNVLSDPDASDTAKANAASGLARLGLAEQEREGGKIHRLTRRQIQAEIARTRAKLAAMPD